MTEEQKAERKTLTANNKAMESAGFVRREVVKTLLARKQAPKGWQYFTVHAITHHPETASGYQGEVAEETEEPAHLSRLLRPTQDWLR